MTDAKKIELATRMILEAIGEDPEREGLKDTPARVARMYEELTKGYDMDEKEDLSRVFYAPGSELVVEKDITFASTCEHHLMPFFGKVHIGYIPSDKVVGLSKLARVVDVFSRRLQLQERLNRQIADAIFNEVGAKGVYVVIEAEHTCMSVRGVKRVGAKTLTTATCGEFPDSLKTLVYANGI